MLISWCFTESLPMTNRCMRHDLNESIARCYVALDKTAEAVDLAQNLVISCTVSCGSLINFLLTIMYIFLSIGKTSNIHVWQFVAHFKKYHYYWRYIPGMPKKKNLNLAVKYQHKCRPNNTSLYSSTTDTA